MKVEEPTTALSRLVTAANDINLYFAPVVDETHFDNQEREMFKALEAALVPFNRVAAGK